MMLGAIVLLPFACACLPLLAQRRGPNVCAWVTAAVPAAALACLLLLASELPQSPRITATLIWLPQLGLDLSLVLDGLGLLFAGLILTVGLLVILYARYYLADTDPGGRLYAALLVFMGAMLGVVLSNNLLLLFVFWELTGLASFVLIGYRRSDPQARSAARMALTVTGAGGLALLAGLLLIGHIVGSHDLAQVIAARDRLQAHPWFAAALLLVLLGAFTKSAQFPFHFWLPRAMAAPTPVSAYLHSATMVKAGIFLLARLYPALGGNDLWFFVVSGTGLATLLYGACVALFQHDIKGLLAYSTVSHLGLITLLLGLDSPLAVTAGLFHILNHAVFKASLFMAAGIIDHETGTRDMRRLNGLWRHMPVTGTLAMLAASAMAGVPLLNGFLSKEMFFAETLFVDSHFAYEWLVPVGATVAGTFAVAYSLRFVHDVFFNGEPVGLTRVPHEPPRWMRVPVELLVLVCLVVGLAPGYTVQPLLDAAAAATLAGPAPEHRIALWHGWNAAVGMSALALAGGTALYFGLQRIYNLHRLATGTMRATVVFEVSMTVLLWVGRCVAGVFARPSLQRSLVVLVFVAMAAAYAPIAERGFSLGHIPLAPVDAGSLLVWAMLVVTAVLVVVFHRVHYTALVVTGAVGLLVCLVFVRFSAPDLALTQLAVEIATVILLMLGLRFLPPTTPREGSTRRVAVNVAAAMLAGVGVTALTAAVLTRPLRSVSGYYLDKSLPEGGGANAVNVIIVDFRGYDTLGEIVVLAIAGLVVHALVRGMNPPPTDLPASAPATGSGGGRTTPMLRLATQVMLPFALLVALHLFLRGHQAPGGGFVAGLVAAIAITAWHIGVGKRWSRLPTPRTARRLLGLGLAIALATGIGSWMAGSPFLTSTTPHFTLPLLGNMALPSAALFDLGVFLTVLGSTLLATASFARIERSPAQREA